MSPDPSRSRQPDPPWWSQNDSSIVELAGSQREQLIQLPTDLERPVRDDHLDPRLDAEPHLLLRVHGPDVQLATAGPEPFDVARVLLEQLNIGADGRARRYRALDHRDGHPVFGQIDQGH